LTIDSVIIKAGERNTCALIHAKKAKVAMSEILSRLRGDELIGLLLIVGCFVFGIAVVIAICWYKLRNAEIAASLKQDMLNRGMSAEEIKTVIEAGSKKWLAIPCDSTSPSETC
jgi:hypothetical protein